MSEEQEGGLSGLKKTIIGVVTTAITAAGVYLTTNINEFFGVEEIVLLCSEMFEGLDEAAVLNDGQLSDFLVNVVLSMYSLDVLGVMMDALQAVGRFN